MSSDIRLIAPVNDGVADAAAAVFAWSASTHADAYRLQVARDSAFLDVVFDARIPQTDTITLFNTLRPRQEAYHWRLQPVRAGSETWSEAGTFRAVSDVQKATQTQPAANAATPQARGPVSAGNSAPTGRPAARQGVQEGVPVPYLTESTSSSLATAVLVVAIVMLVVIGWFVSIGRIWV